MNALLRKKKIWEYHNEKTLLRLVETSTDISIESVKKAGQITSFLLYLAYKILGIMLALTTWMLQRPILKRHISPQHAPKDVEIEKYCFEAKLKNPFQGI